MLKKLSKSIKRISIALTVAILIVAMLSWSLGLFNPVTVNRYTIENGSKIIIFQEMRHVGRTEFYKTVHEDILNYKKNNFIYIYEGIFDIPSHYYFNTYPVFPDSFFMEQPLNLGNINENDINADFSLDIIESKIQEKLLLKEFNFQSNEKFIPKTENGVSFYEYLEEKNKIDPVKYTENNIIRIRYFLNLLKLFPDEYVREKTKTVDTSIIIDERDQLILDAIIESKKNKFFIQYGERHFDGFYKRLKKHNKNWQITNIEERIIL